MSDDEAADDDHLEGPKFLGDYDDEDEDEEEELFAIVGRSDSNMDDDEYGTADGVLNDNVWHEEDENETSKPDYAPAGHQIIRPAVGARPTAFSKSRVLDILTQKSPAAQQFNIPSPLSSAYSMLLKDPAYCHALYSGQCWQSLVGQLVRFPPNWWNGARGPPLGVPNMNGRDQPLWQFYGRFRIWNNENLTRVVPNRAAPGMLMLHLIVQDLVTLRPVRDVVVGVYHPNARGVRRSAEPNPQDEQRRDIWLAVRKREEGVSVVDNVLSFGIQESVNSPLGAHHINNRNMRAVFGDHPPMDTMFLAEDILYGRLTVALELTPELSPAEALLREFVFEE
jgi:hypothetical protein